MSEEQRPQDSEITDTMKEVVIARIEAQALSTLKLFIGSSKGLTKEEMIEHVRRGDELGKVIVQSHLRFMKALARGEVVRALTKV